jgi:hypothetical protein
LKFKGSVVAGLFFMKSLVLFNDRSVMSGLTSCSFTIRSDGFGDCFPAQVGAAISKKSGESEHEKTTILARRGRNV